MLRQGILASGILAAALLAAPTPAYAASGSFDVLTYNVAGLPELLSSAEVDRQTAHTAIGQRLGPYEVVQVQEDFNYHAYLYAADTTHAYRTPTSGGAGIGSGLNTLSTLPYDTDDFERGDWDSCQLDSGDCLTPKGFTFARTRVADGVYVDFYNLHTNAGTNAGDQESRASNLSQLTAFIASHSAGNAVIVMGDTNTRYTRAADTIRDFTAANGLTDAWVKLERGGVAPAAGADALLCDAAAITDTCEVVDKILYRSSRAVTLNAVGYHNEHAGFVTSDGLMLSDHFPISTSFSWTSNPAYQVSEQFGGPHGDHYNDIGSAGRLSSIGLRAGTRVDQVSATLAGGSVLAHGGTGGTAKTLSLGSGEYVTSAYLCRGVYSGRTRIFYVRFTTNLGNSIAGGTTTSDCVTRTAPAGAQIAGFHGRSGTAVDKVGFIYTPR
ncbi:endonuclease/exonuclease/phosphatase family metal-dependent hydrolase [Actinoplanes lutulentus]|uniref:Endonuclease/exonuclease/phosphatase family metal-dependent hydrolase n=1 Tax=Actinoplanes lutulentus TaxID=1287878 RepID=A0A327ZJB4_9ACTN|nr:jacalin-like lectin [Actinoplanes lutulentus]MBB2944257.1 endonuclease/exonuclease/phosphatase family metal-dependent hydrolase [Actinoplanes lutulentus]RAK42510.1 endonuclease/exonuclease/phosphatase family metal-dependent hydrolase [Actinoplanes lutulentus]